MLSSITSYKELINYIQDKSIEKLKKEFNENGIFVQVEKTELPRILLTNFHNSSHKRYINFICNGIIIHQYALNKYKYLAIPIQKLYLKYNISSLNLYKIYPIIDGTVINMYYYNNKWVLSTKHAYEVNNYYWKGPLNFEEIILDLLNPYGINDMTFDDLSKEYSYTFIFHHSNFHPYNNEQNNIWKIHQANLKTYEIEKIKQLSYLQPQVELTFSSLPQIHSYLTSDFHRFPFGFILFNKNPQHRSLMMESKLYQKLKKFVYTDPGKGIPCVTHQTREYYNALYAYLLPQRKSEFIELFPFYIQFYKYLDNKIEYYVSCIQKCLSQKLSYNKISRMLYSKISADKRFHELIKTYHLQPTEYTRKIIHDIICSPYYLDLYGRELIPLYLAEYNLII